MRKKVKILLCLFAVLAASCDESITETDTSTDTSTETGTGGEGESDTSEITFSAAITTRATDTAFESGDKISVTAYDTDMTPYAQNVSYSYDGSLFSSTSAIEYASDDQQLMFYAVYPYMEVEYSSEASFTVKSDQSVDSGYTLSDLMLSYLGATSSTTPTLSFDHLLTKLVINITSSDVDLDGAVATLDALPSVTYSLSTLSATATGNTTAITMASNGTSSYKAILAPQTISAGSFFGAVTVAGVSYDISYSSDIELVAGKEVTINATVQDGEISMDSPVINGWGEGGEVVLDSSYKLSYFSAESYPVNIDTWTILDDTATTDDFAGLREALTALENSGREISLQFPNLEAFPEGALYQDWSDEYSSLKSVSADVATTLGEYAFEGCISLTSVDLPLVTVIGGSAFRNCTSLTSVNFPLVTEIYYTTFHTCTSLTSVDLPLVTVIIGYGAFYCCTSLTSVNLPLLTEIGTYAFYGCTSLTSVDFPLVTEMYDMVFNNCSSLTTVILPLVTEIKQANSSYSYGSFSNCTSLTTVYLPLITDIGRETFYNCTSLTTVDCPLLTVIGSYAFYGCSSLTTLSIAIEDEVNISPYAFDGATTENIDLTIGSANSECVSGTTFTSEKATIKDTIYGGNSWTFKSITVI